MNSYQELREFQKLICGEIEKTNDTNNFIYLGFSVSDLITLNEAIDKMFERIVEGKIEE